MNTDRPDINVYIQLATLITVVLGLGLVVYELRLNHSVASASLLQSTIASTNQRLMSQVSDDPRSALYKAAVCPEQLTAEESVTLDSYYRTFVILWSTEWQVSGLLDVDRNAGIRGMVRQYFTTEPARRWLEHQLTLDMTPIARFPEVVSAVRSALDEPESGSHPLNSHKAILNADTLSCEFES